MIYQVDVDICATVYVRASSPEEAMQKLHAALPRDTFDLEVKGAGNCEIEISGARFDSADLPEVSMSPAMTGYKLTDGKPVEAADFYGAE
jgi:hypothetical protein